MHNVIIIKGLCLPIYGLILWGALILLVMGSFIIIKKENQNIFDGIVLGTYGLLGAFVGAKIFYYLGHVTDIDFLSSQGLLQMITKGA